MDRKKEEAFRKFEGRLKILIIRARYVNDERAIEYSDILEKIESIKERRHFGLIGEENEEKTLYKALLAITAEEFNTEKEFEVILKNVETLLINYRVDKKSIAKKEERDDGEER